jgi:hypothetical protein
MRLETLGNIRMRYSRGSWHRPYTQGTEPAEEGFGFGQGDGELSGEIEGSLVWANFPRHRQDGVWTPNLRGCITTVRAKKSWSASWKRHPVSGAQSWPGSS